MPLSLDAHNMMLNALGAAATRVALSKATVLTAAAAQNATQVTLARPVKVGDYISLNDGVRETFKVIAVSGNTATLGKPGAGSVAATVTKAGGHGINTPVGVAPKVGTDLIEPSGGAGYARQPVTWFGAAGESLDNNANPSFSVAGGNDIGGFALFSTDGNTYYGSFLTMDIEGFGAAGTYQLTDADVNLLS